MDTSIIGLIVIAAISVALLAAALAWIMLTRRRQDRPVDPSTAREDRKREKAHVKDQEALGDPTFAEGHRAASAEANAAHAARLEGQIGTHRTEAATTSQDHLDGLRDVADAMSDLPGPRHTKA